MYFGVIVMRSQQLRNSRLYIVVGMSAAYPAKFHHPQRQHEQVVSMVTGNVFICCCVRGEGVVWLVRGCRWD